MEDEKVPAPGSTTAKAKWDIDPVSAEELEILNFTLPSPPAEERAFSARLHHMLGDLDALVDIDDASGLPRGPRVAADWPLILAPLRSPRPVKSQRHARRRVALTPQIAWVILAILLFAGLGTTMAGVMFEKELSRTLDRWDGILRAHDVRSPR